MKFSKPHPLSVGNTVRIVFKSERSKAFDIPNETTIMAMQQNAIVVSECDSCNGLATIRNTIGSPNDGTYLYIYRNFDGCTAACRPL